MPVSREKRLVTRYFTKGEFNPRSRDQLLAYMESQGYSGGAPSEKTGKPTVDKKVLEALAKKDPLFQDILNHKAISKVRSTYVDSTERKIAKGDLRLHAQYKHKPSTMRMSCVNPNLTNIVADKSEDKEQGRIATGFRDCIVAAPGCLLLEADKAAVEAVLTGWCMKDPNFIRLAKLGVHSYHASHVIGKPVSLKQSDEDLGKALKAIKKLDKPQYDRSKTCTYSTLFGQSPYGLHKTWPEIFPTIAAAESNQQVLFQLVPNLPKWHNELRLQAHKMGFLGLNQHPFKYRHWFWDVFSYNTKSGKYGLGADSKRVVAYYPQSINAGLIKEDALRVMDKDSKYYIGDTFFGKTPIRAIIHDSILCEVEEQHVPKVIQALQIVMTRPIPELPCPPEWGIGSHLSIGVAIKVGKDWGHMEEVELGELGVASDSAVREPEEEEELTEV